MTSRGGSNAPLPPHGAASASCGPTATTGPSIDAGAAASSSASNATLPAPGSALPPHGAASASCGPTATTGPSIDAGAAASSSARNATLPAPGSALPPHGAASASCGPTTTTGPSIDAGAAASSSASNATLPAPGSALPPHGAASASCGPTTTTGPSIEAGAAASSSTSNATLPAPGSASASRGLTTAPSSPSSQTSCSATISLVIPVTPRFFERYAEVKELVRSFASIRGGLQRIWDGVETLGGLKTIPGVFNWISSVLDSVGDVWEGSYQAINTLASHSLPSTVHCYPKPHRLLGHSSAYGLHTILEHRVLTRSHLDSSMLVYVNGLPRPKTVPGVKIVTSLAELTDEVEMYMKDASSVQLLDIPDGISLELAKKMWEYVLANKAVGILRPESRLGHICKAAALLEDEKDKVQRQIVILNARLRRLEDDISNLAVNSSSKQSSNV